MKKILLCLCILLVYHGLCAQDAETSKQILMAEKHEANKNYKAAFVLRNNLEKKAAKSKDDWAYKNSFKKNMAGYEIAETNAEALPYIEKAVTQLKLIKSPTLKDKASAYFNLYNCRIENDKIPEALNAAFHLISLIEKQQDDFYKEQYITVLHDMAYMESLQLNYEAAIKHQKEAVQKSLNLYGRLSEKTATSYILLTEIYSYTLLFKEQLEASLNALSILESIPLQSKYLLFKQYFNIINDYKYYGDITKAAHYLKKLENLYERNKHSSEFLHSGDYEWKNIDGLKLMIYYSNIRYNTLVGNEEKIMHYLGLYEKLLPKNTANFTPIEINVATSVYLESGGYYHNKNYYTARKIYNKALAITKNSNNVFGIIQTYDILGTLAIDHKMWNDAIDAVNNALRYPDVSTHHTFLNLNHNLGCAYTGLNDYQKAYPYFDMLLKDYLAKEDELSSYGPLQNLVEIGEAYTKIYKATKEKAIIEKAFTAFKTASDIFSRLYQGGEFNDRLAFFQQRIASGLLYSSDILKDEKDVAIALIEQNSSDLLWSNLLKKHDKSLKEPLELEKKIGRLKSEYASLLKQKEELPKPNAAGIKAIEEKADKKQHEIKSAEENFKTDYASYYAFSKNSFDATALQQKLKENELIIKYIIADSLVYAYSISNSALQLHPLTVKSEELERYIKQYTSQIKSLDKNYAAISTKLYNMLLKPLPVKEYDNIVIVTDGYLGYLPFETLQDKPGKYFFQEHAVSYSTSLKIWEIQNMPRENNGYRMGAFSPDYDLKLASVSKDNTITALVRSGLYELPGAQDEAKNIAAFFNGDLFLKEAASKANFLANSPNYNLLHLAMHAVTDEENDNESNLIFNNNEKLFFSELYEMNIPADMAVLSACNTGNGAIKNGEGIMSISRAFTYAGVKCTVISLWQVPDKETSEIMISFYENLKNGEPKDVALANAKKKFLQNNPLKTHPFYWAGFIVNGDVSAVASGNSKIYWIAGISVLLILSVVAFRKKLFKFSQ